MRSDKFHHYGVPVLAQQENEAYYEDIKVFGTDPDAHPYRIEFLRFEADCPLPEEVQTKCHAAFEVDNLDEAIEGYKVILEPFNVSDTLKIAFVMDDQALIELMQTL